MLRALISTRLSRPTSAIVVGASLCACVLATAHELQPSAAYRRALDEVRHEQITAQIHHVKIGPHLSVEAVVLTTNYREVVRAQGREGRRRTGTR
jgi:hypothetical protein